MLWCDIKIRNDTLDPRLQGCPWWWHQEEKLCTSKISILVEKLCRAVMLVVKLLCWWWGIVVLVRENEACFFEDVQRGALMWHKDQKRHTWPASPGLPLMMTSRKETLHFEDLYLSRETLSGCHVSRKTALLMMRDSCVSERKWSLLLWRCSKNKLRQKVSPETLFDNHVSHKTDVLMMMDSWEMKFASLKTLTDDDIKKRNSTLRRCLAQSGNSVSLSC